MTARDARAPTLSYLGSPIVRPHLLVASVAFTVVSWVSASLYYLGSGYGNEISWISWLLAVGTFCAAFLKPAPFFASLSRRTIVRSELAICVLVLLLYLPTHLWNFPVAPWNTNGLFDDAAWDIYFSRLHAFNGPFQAAFFDGVGLISREVVFHYYITVFFKVFGYNLLVFIAALLLIGYVTVLFTTLIVHRLFGNPLITMLSAILINFLPVQYLQIFVGHRYAIAAPLMVVSLYFLYSGFLQRSFFRVAVSALFAALCLDSAVMGKQYVLGLVAAGVLIPIVDRHSWRSHQARALALCWVSGFIVSATPLLAYIVFNADAYFNPERGILAAFLAHYAEQGVDGVRPYFERLAELFFAKDSLARLWLPDFPIIPFAYYPLLLLGLVVALLRRRLELVFLAILPVVSALVAGAFDFRVLLAAPIWVICIAYSLDFLTKGRFVVPWRRSPALLWAGAALGLLILGVVPAMSYLWGVSKDTHRSTLPHRDVAVSRLIQDVVAGSSTPSSAMKSDEFDRNVDQSKVAFDAFVCSGNAYAIIHLYLQAFDDRRILAFCDQGNERLLGSAGMIRSNVATVEAYERAGKALKLIWEDYPDGHDAIGKFRRYEVFGSWQTLSGSVDGEPFSVHVLTIAKEYVSQFQTRVAADYSEGLL